MNVNVLDEFITICKRRVSMDAFCCKWIGPSIDEPFPFPQMEWVLMSNTHKACSALEGAPNDQKADIQKCITCLGEYKLLHGYWNL